MLLRYERPGLRRPGAPWELERPREARSKLGVQQMMGCREIEL